MGKQTSKTAQAAKHTKPEHNAKLSTKEYEKKLYKLHAELVKLQY